MSAIAEQSEVIVGTPVSFSRRDEAQLPAVQGPTSLVEALARAASDPRTDMDKMERLFAMHQTMLKQQAEAAFNDAMARAQAKIVPVANNALNTHTNSRYAKLAAINKAITPIYTAEGLSISFNSGVSPLPGLHRTIAIVAHSGGHSRDYHLDLALDDAGAKGTTNKTSVQAMGSTSSYARRYLVCMIFNVSTEDDDDGNKGGDGNRMDESDVADHLSAIDEAADNESLRATYREAYQAAEAAKDKGAMRLFIQHKDARKKALAK